MELLDQKPLFDTYAKENPCGLSAFSFVNVFAWKEHFHFQFEIINNNLCIFAKNDLGMFLYLPPLGKQIQEKTIHACFEFMDEANGESCTGYSRIENVTAQQLSLFPPDEFSSCRKGYEYCYYRPDLVSLQGNVYKSKRWAYNHFVKHYDFHYAPYEEAMLSECRALYARWAVERKQACSDEIFGHMLEENRDVHSLVLRHAKELGLTGRVVYVDGKLKAYTFGYPLNAETFCILFEIVDLDMKGLPVYIFREFCADAALEGFKFINVMDGFAMKNVERTKLSFRPGILFPAYTVTRKRG